MENGEIKPNAQQWQVLNLVHRRCLYEQEEETNHRVNQPASKKTHWEPLFRLIHGLPGSGKSKLLLWLRTYFEEVWKWTDGVQFQFVAPLNSMANNIGGSTMHTWAGLTFTNSEGLQISGDMLRKGKDNISRRQIKCAKLRFLYIDEIACRWNSLCFTHKSTNLNPARFQSM